MPKTLPSKKRRLVERYRTEPTFFIERVLGAQLWSKQREIANSVRDNRRTAVKACHGPGKTFTAAAVVLWFLRLPNARVITTAPTWTQVRSLLWHEIRGLHGGSRYDYGGEIGVTRLDMPDGRYAIGLSTKKEQSESFQGHHAENILIVYDEASGVPQPIFEAGEGYMTTDGARMLLIGNPTRPTGEFYDAFHSKRALYETINISAFDLPAYTGEAVPAQVAKHLTGKGWVEEHRIMWGENSPLWQVKVLGDFPAEADDSVVSLAALEAAQVQELEQPPDAERVIGVDVARFGSDETVFSYREGTRIRILDHYIGKRTTHTSGRAIELANEHGGKDRVRIVVDDPGVGGGVTDMLVEQGWKVTAFNGGEEAVDPTSYPNRRSEVWFEAVEQMESIDLDPDDQLAADLLAPLYKLDSKGRRVVEPKQETKKRLGRSPDRGDSVLLTLVADTSATAEVW